MTFGTVSRLESAKSAPAWATVMQLIDGSASRCRNWRRPSRGPVEASERESRSRNRQKRGAACSRACLPLDSRPAGRTGGRRSRHYSCGMGMTYNLRECEEQDAFCETLVRALPDDIIAVRQPRRAGRSMASLYLEGKGDLYHLVTDTLRAVPWELWCAVSSHRLDRHTAEAIEQRPLFGPSLTTATDTGRITRSRERASPPLRASTDGRRPLAGPYRLNG